jgi:TetR/AcrR family transcriptional regulator, transcriptional repressor for nem operon
MRVPSLCRLRPLDIRFCLGCTKSVRLLNTMTAQHHPGKRSQLIQSAMTVVYRHGFREARLVDIAADANVPPGNVYYYFKTKEEIGAAIVDEHLAQIKGLQLRLDKLDSPQERLCAFVQVTFENRKMLARGGCPTGTLCTELHKEEGTLAKRSTVLFEQLLGWLKAQFEALGLRADSRGLAVHLLSALEGTAVLAHSLSNPKIVSMETERLQEWIRTLGTKLPQE